MHPQNLQGVGETSSIFVGNGEDGGWAPLFFGGAPVLLEPPHYKEQIVLVNDKSSGSGSGSGLHSMYCTIEAITDRCEASRRFSATAGLLV